MLKFEYNMLVLNSIFSDDDVEEINKFADYIRNQEQERIIALLEAEIVEVGKDERFLWEPQAIIALIKGDNNG